MRSDFLKFAAGFGFETNSEGLWTTVGGSSQMHLNKIFSVARSYKSGKLTVYDGCLQSYTVIKQILYDMGMEGRCEFLQEEFTVAR
jgi:hypothetical protein